jgi:hypothetical protein
MVAHLPTVYENHSFDHWYADLTFNACQPSSSPANMRMYELCDLLSTNIGSQAFINHENIPQSPTPDFTGQRVATYRHLTRLARDVNSFGYVFRHKDGCYKHQPDFFDNDLLYMMNDICSKRRAKDLFDSCYEFKKKSVRAWNVAAGLVTKSLLLGVVGIDEGNAEGAMACVLDLLLKYNVLQEESDGSWSRVPSRVNREMMCFGDRTTNENIAAFILSLQDRPMSLEEASIQSEVFLDAVLDTQFLPGDWHTSLNMLQSIFNVHWHWLLSPLKDMLKWCRISVDVCGCYYQASKLVMLTNQSFKAYLIQAVVTKFNDEIRGLLDSELDRADVIVEIVKKYQLWLIKNKYSDDEFLRAASNFIIMSDDLIDFVDSIRRQDSIGIEDGYQCFAPVWKFLGQLKYLQSYFEQLVMNNQYFPYHRRMTQLMNRTVRTYDESTGKSAVAHDEFLEVCNRDLSLFPSVRSMAGRVRQGNLVGPAKRCKRVVDQIYSPGDIEKTSVWRSSSGSKGNHMLEKDLLYELAGLFLGDITVSQSRKLRKDSVSKLASKVTTVLKRDKLAKEMTNQTDDETSRLFNSVSHVQASARGGEIADTEDDSPYGITTADEIQEEDVHVTVEDWEAAMDDLQITREIDETADSDSNEDDKADFKKCLIDIWSRGWFMIDYMNYKEVRKRQDDRLARKKKMQKQVLDLVKQMKVSSSNSVIIDEEMPPIMEAPWTRMVHELDADRYLDY